MILDFPKDVRVSVYLVRLLNSDVEQIRESLLRGILDIDPLVLIHDERVQMLNIKTHVLF